VAAAASEVPITERHRILFGDFRSKPKISTIGGRPITSETFRDNVKNFSLRKHNPTGTFYVKVVHLGKIISPKKSWFLLLNKEEIKMSSAKKNKKKFFVVLFPRQLTPFWVKYVCGKDSM